MSDTEKNRELFEEIWALSGADTSRAGRLASESKLIVRMPNGVTGVLTGVSWLGNPQIRVEAGNGYSVDTLHFNEIKATGYAMESA